MENGLSLSEAGKSMEFFFKTMIFLHVLKKKASKEIVTFKNLFFFMPTENISVEKKVLTLVSETETPPCICQ